MQRIATGELAKLIQGEGETSLTGTDELALKRQQLEHVKTDIEPNWKLRVSSGQEQFAKAIHPTESIPPS